MEYNLFKFIYDQHTRKSKGTTKTDGKKQETKTFADFAEKPHTDPCLLKIS